MSDVPRQTLRELIARYGPGLCSDERRCEGLLRDLCGAHRREINILMGALRERVPLDLLAARNSVPRDLLLTRLAKRLEEHLALTEEAARWAVDSWALALGIVADAELEERKSLRIETPAPRVAAAPPPDASPQTPVKDETQARRAASNPNTPTPATQPRTQRSPPPLPTQSPPVSRTHAHAHSPPQASSNVQLQTTSPEPVARSRRWRGCLVGCLLLILLCGLLFLGGPFVLNVLREEQRQRSLESPPLQTR